MLLPALFLSTTLPVAASALVSVEPPAQFIVGGEPVETCGWPAVVDIGGCTAGLITPKVISVAKHCSPGPGTRVNFGETRGEVSGTTIKQCVQAASGSEDSAICELEDEITEIPPAPIIYGCELDKYLKAGQPVWLIGFGQLSAGNASNRDKYWVEQKINEVMPTETWIGELGDGKSPCPGDSGGPAYIKTDDGSYRTIGSVWGGTDPNGTMCNSRAKYSRLDVLVEEFESKTGVDITPCFDAATGDWEPGDGCGGFFAGSETGHGTWDNWCEGTPKSDKSTQCGDDGTDTGTDETSSEETSTSTDTSETSTSADTSDSTSEDGSSVDTSATETASDSETVDDSGSETTASTSHEHSGEDTANSDATSEDGGESSSDDAGNDTTSSKGCSTTSKTNSLWLAGLAFAGLFGWRRRRSSKV